MDECVDTLGEAAIFYTLDAKSENWQIDIEESNRDRAECTSPHYRFIRMPFGIRNAPGSFQRTVEVILVTVKGQFQLVYLEDTVIFSHTTEEHIQHIREVLTLLKNTAVNLKLRKVSIPHLNHRLYGTCYAHKTPISRTSHDRRYTRTSLTDRHNKT